MPLDQKPLLPSDLSTGYHIPSARLFGFSCNGVKNRRWACTDLFDFILIRSVIIAVSRPGKKTSPAGLVQRREPLKSPPVARAEDWPASFTNNSITRGCLSLGSGFSTSCTDPHCQRLSLIKLSLLRATHVGKLILSNYPNDARAFSHCN